MIDLVLVMRFTTKPCELISEKLLHIWLYKANCPKKTKKINKYAHTRD